MKYALAAGATLAALVFAGVEHTTATENVAKATVAPTPSPVQSPSCAKTFTVHMATRAANAVYAGARRVTRHNRQMLHRILTCQRNPNAQAFVAAYYQRAAHAHARRVYLREHPPQVPDVASWYSDGGATACGWHASYGVANRTLPCGTRVLICYPYHSKRCVAAAVDDRGPFVGGRNWDLNQNVASAVGFDGVGTIGVHIY